MRDVLLLIPTWILFVADHRTETAQAIDISAAIDQPGNCCSDQYYISPEMEAFGTCFNTCLQSNPKQTYERNIIFYLLPEIAVLFNGFLKLQMNIYKLT